MKESKTLEEILANFEKHDSMFDVGAPPEEVKAWITKAYEAGEAAKEKEFKKKFLEAIDEFGLS